AFFQAVAWLISQQGDLWQVGVVFIPTILDVANGNALALAAIALPREAEVEAGGRGVQIALVDVAVEVWPVVKVVVVGDAVIWRQRWRRRFWHRESAFHLIQRVKQRNSLRRFHARRQL